MTSLYKVYTYVQPMIVKFIWPSSRNARFYELYFNPIWINICREIVHQKQIQLLTRRPMFLGGINAFKRSNRARFLSSLNSLYMSSSKSYIGLLYLCWKWAVIATLCQVIIVLIFLLCWILFQVPLQPLFMYKSYKKLYFKHLEPFFVTL